MHEERYIDLGGVRARYWERGTGAPLLLIHGIGGCLEDWAGNLPAFAQRFRVLALDLVGFGRSDKPRASYSLPFLAWFVRDFLDRLRVSRANVVALSMGGAVALEFARLYPERLDRLVLVGSAGLGRELAVEFRLPTLPVVGEAGARATRLAVTRILRLSVHDAARDLSELIELHVQLGQLPGATESFLACLRTNCNARGQRPEIFGPLLAALPRFQAPTLVLWGREDKIIPVAHAYVAARALVRSRLRVLDRCGHLVQFEHPDTFNAAVMEFLSKNGAGP